MGSKRFNDTAILDAILTTATIPAAAAKAGCPVSTVIRRLNDAAFQQRVEDARRKIFDNSMERLTAARTAAIDLLIETVTDEFAEVSTRLRAAGLIMQYTKPTDGSGGR